MPPSLVLVAGDSEKVTKTVSEQLCSGFFVTICWDQTTHRTKAQIAISNRNPNVAEKEGSSANIRQRMLQSMRIVSAERRYRDAMIPEGEGFVQESLKESREPIDKFKCIIKIYI